MRNKNIDLKGFVPYIKEKTTRFAPSPTGNLHIGGLRSALISYASAKQINGKFILRIEDTDRKRFVPQATYQILDILFNFGLEPDYYPTIEQITRSINNDFGWYTNTWAQHLSELDSISFSDYKDIFIQSLRLPIYQKVAWYLVQNGWAYFCFCSPQRLEEVNKQKKLKGQQPGYDGYCKTHVDLETALKRIKKGETPVVRMNFDKLKQELKTNKLEFTDKLIGKVEFDLNLQNDGVLLKSDGFPTYHLAVVVDDYLMNVDTTIRGYEWISSVPKHMLVAKALKIKDPQTLHLPVILDPHGGKLSKRSGSVSVYDMLAQGYVPEALLNYLMTLGLNVVEDGQRPIISLTQFLEKFNMKKLNKANPVFDRKKLDWINAQYLANSNIYKFTKHFVWWLAQFKQQHIEFIKQNIMQQKIVLSHTPKATTTNLNDHTITQILETALGKIIKSMPYPLVSLLSLTKVRNNLLQDVLIMILPFYLDLKPMHYSGVKGVKRYSADILYSALNKFLQSFKAQDFKNNEEFANTVRNIADEYNIKHGDLFMLIRLAVYGFNISPPLFEYLKLLPKNKAVEKLEEYLNILNS